MRKENVLRSRSSVSRRSKPVCGPAAGVRSGRGGTVVVRTAFGAIAIRWRDRGGEPRVERILLPGDREQSGRRARASDGRGSCPRIDEFASRIETFCAGMPIEFDIDILDLDACGLFQRRVLLAERLIPRGRVSTYGRIARHIGHPGAARAVGNALARNPFPIAIPCHRAVREGGAIGGFGGGVAMKRRLLELEGVPFGSDGRVVMDRVHYASQPRSRRGRGAGKGKERE